MSDDKKQPPRPLDDLKEGLGLLFRAAKGAVEQFPTEKVEETAKEAAKQVGKTFEVIGNEMDKAFTKATGSEPPPKADAAPPAEAKKPGGDDAPKGEAPNGDPPKGDEPKKFDDAYAPEPPKGPRVG
jgi:hypothetical protein